MVFRGYAFRHFDFAARRSISIVRRTNLDLPDGGKKNSSRPELLPFAVGNSPGPTGVQLTMPSRAKRIAIGLSVALLLASWALTVDGFFGFAKHSEMD